MALRKNISASLRMAVWNDNMCPDKMEGLCYVGCGTKISYQQYECGHIISVASNGPNELANLKPICSKCNKSMGSTNMIEFIKDMGFTPSWLNVVRSAILIETIGLTNHSLVEELPNMPNLIVSPIKIGNYYLYFGKFTRNLTVKILEVAPKVTNLSINGNRIFTHEYNAQDLILNFPNELPELMVRVYANYRTSLISTLAKYLAKDEISDLGRIILFMRNHISIDQNCYNLDLDIVVPSIEKIPLNCRLCIWEFGQSSLSDADILAEMVRYRIRHYSTSELFGIIIPENIKDYKELILKFI